MQTLNQIFSALTGAVVPVVISALGLVLHQLWMYLGNHISTIKNQQAGQVVYVALDEADRVTSVVMAALNNTVLTDLKTQNGGTLSKSDWERVKKDTLEKIKTILSDEAKGVLKNHLGDIDLYLQHLVDSKVDSKPL